jgi:hypothetical protein
MTQEEFNNLSISDLERLKFILDSSWNVWIRVLLYIISASLIEYSNTSSWLLATNVQSAIDEVVNILVNNVVHDTWNETIWGTKTFTTIPELPASDPTTANQATRKSYVDWLVVWLIDDRWNYDASVNTFPASGGSWTAWAIMKWDLWYISVAWNLWWTNVVIWDSVRALTDTPLQTAWNWSILEGNIGYVPENQANKISAIIWNSETSYPSEKAVKDYVSANIMSSQTYMLSSVNSDITGYESMPLITNYTAWALTTITQSVTTSATLMEEFITPLWYPNTVILPVWQFTCHIETQKASWSNNYFTFFELYKRASWWTETLLLTSDNSSQSSVNTVVQNTITAFNLSRIDLLATDRLVIKVYCQMIWWTVNIDLLYDDNTDTRFTTPAVTVDASLYLQKSNNLSDLTNASTARTNLWLWSLSTQFWTFSWVSSWTNTWDQTISRWTPVTATAGQTVVTTPTYVLWSNKLMVFVNWNLQEPTIDYTETSTTSITFWTWLLVNNKVTFRLLS